ncbi:hypothetical protein RGQ29_015275 [Quercus rubra]|uniref:Uncharacterized protein n=1 Tax=Quercus rubra TaxID=3512 RepID=A0AAN7FVQ0_QUERU|nr:hypothetical protein RGQ29_015275 [Quercus rubra]
MDECSSICSNVGSCVPVSNTSDSALTLQCSIGSTESTQDSVFIEPPIKEKKVDCQNSRSELSLKPQSSAMSTVGSSRELNTTPSCGNTPIHHCGFKETPHVKKPVYMDSSSNPILEPSPTDMKKQLIELFQESFRDDAIDGSQNIQERSKANAIICPLSSKSTNKNLHGCVANSACSSEAIHNRSYNHGKGKFAESARCCLPNLMRSLSFSGRRKRLSLAGP